MKMITLTEHLFCVAMSALHLRTRFVSLRERRHCRGTWGRRKRVLYQHFWTLPQQLLASHLQGGGGRACHLVLEHKGTA